MDLARRNLDAALHLLSALRRRGLELMVVCPGSRSAPLAVAAGLLEGHGLRLHTALDERSAAFFALGWSRARGLGAAVLTTSGTAVANLLPAAVEADYGTIPLLLISADRPARLKNRGANQTVNQQRFLEPSVRRCLQGDPRGLAEMDAPCLLRLAAAVTASMAGSGLEPPGPVHLNLPIEEPLHPGDSALLEQRRHLAEDLGAALPVDLPVAPPASAEIPLLDPDAPGLVIAGVWRGRPQHWDGFVEALARWQQRTSWPVLADGASGLRACSSLKLICGADLLGSLAGQFWLPGQLLRLGPVPISRRLQELLRRCGGRQLLITEGEPRDLDPLSTSAVQWSGGLAAWLAQLPPELLTGQPAPGARDLASRWCGLEAALQQRLTLALAEPAWGEPALVRQLQQLLPADRPLVLANSSPVRDWDSFTTAGRAGPVYAFRGASGIDGTLSMACGVAVACGGAVLLSGDLALLHDSNGWLWRRQLHVPLTVLLIDNGGGGIFEQLPIRSDDDTLLDFDRLFAMPQDVDPLALAAAHGVPGRRVTAADQLEKALAWALLEPLALLQLCTDRRSDAVWRDDLRRMASDLVPPS